MAAIDGPKTKHAGGRPAKYTSADEMREVAYAYFRDCDKRKAPYTISGLALALGFEDRRSLLDYKARTPEFSRTVKELRAYVERSVEERLLGSNGVVAGQIFNLKNNFGWRDSKELEVKDPDGFFARDTLKIEIVDGAPEDQQQTEDSA